ncbi:hypothetical protein V8C42DRAFT_313313 [Trichoderma barbatum]
MRRRTRRASRVAAVCAIEAGCTMVVELLLELHGRAVPVSTSTPSLSSAHCGGG